MTTEAEITKGLVTAALTDWRMRLVVSDKGRLVECWQNVYTYLDNHPDWGGVLAFDEFAQRIVKRKAPPFARGASEGAWTAEDDYELGLWLAGLPGSDRFVVKGKQTLMDGVSACAARHKYHPVREFIQKCGAGDKGRLDTWLTDFLGVAPTPYSQAVGRYFLLNMVARVFEPGCIMRSVPVLEGAQDRGKSESWRALAQPWFSDTHFDLNNKDAFEVVQGVWLYEIAELEQFSKKDATAVKQFISSRENNYRPPYERRAQRVPRQVVFGATTNERKHLRDFTGGTRFWPVRCEEAGAIDVPGLAAARDGLFHEAYEAYRNKARRYPTREEQKQHFAPEQDARLQEHPWQERIELWLDEQGPDGSARSRVTVRQVLVECIEIDYARMTAVHARDVGSILTALGWEQREATTRGERGQRGARRFYQRPAAPAVAEETGGREPGQDDEADAIPF